MVFGPSSFPILVSSLYPFVLMVFRDFYRLSWGALT